MAYDVAGLFTRLYNWVNDRDNGTRIEASRMDAEMDGFKDAFNLAFLRDGRATATGNFKLGGYSITGVGAGAAATPSYSFSGDTTTGIYSSAASKVSVAIAGSRRFEVNSSGFSGYGGTYLLGADLPTNTVLTEDGSSSAYINFKISGVEYGYVGAYGLFPSTLVVNGTIGINLHVAGSTVFQVAANYVASLKPLGYLTGVSVGGTVTQITNRTTAVTLNKAAGEITLVSAAGSASWNTFTVNNILVTAVDRIIVNQKSGTDKYQIHITRVAAGAFDITFATTGGTTVEQPVFGFALIKSTNN